MALWAMPDTLCGQIFVTSQNSGTIGEYNYDGTPVNSALVSGLSGPDGLAASGLV